MLVQSIFQISKITKKRKHLIKKLVSGFGCASGVLRLAVVCFWCIVTPVDLYVGSGTEVGAPWSVI